MQVVGNGGIKGSLTGISVGVVSQTDKISQSLQAFGDIAFAYTYSIILIEIKVLDKINNPHYLYRIAILHAISLLAPVMGANITCQKLLPMVIAASKDRVPNIKFNSSSVVMRTRSASLAYLRTFMYRYRRSSRFFL